MTTEGAEDILNTRDANLRASLSSQLLLPTVDFSFSATVNDRTFFDAEINENNTIERMKILFPALSGSSAGRMFALY